MPLLPARRDSLLRFTSRLFDQLAGVRPSSIRLLLSNALAGVGERSDVDHVHLFLISNPVAGERKASAIAHWSRHGRPVDVQRLQRLEVQLFGADVVRRLEAGTNVHVVIGENSHACSRLLSGLLREAQASGYEMIPVITAGRWRGILALAHSHGPSHLDPDSRHLLHLSAHVMVGSLRSARRERRQRVRHRQWKRIADGACDFALLMNPGLTVREVVAFRNRSPWQAKDFTLSQLFDAPSVGLLEDAVRRLLSERIPQTIEVKSVIVRGRQESYSVRIEPPGDRREGTHEEPLPLTLYLTGNDRERAHAEELQALRVQLERAIRLSQLGTIGSWITHDLRQPLQAILGLTSKLQSRLEGRRGSESLLGFIDSIEDRVADMREFIGNIQDFLRDRQPAVQPVPLPRIVHNATLMLESLFDPQPAVLTVRDHDGLLSANPAVLVEAERVQTTHVVFNLLHNAVEACRSTGTPDPHIHVGCGLCPDNPQQVLITVSDNGPGIASDQLSRVFDRFFTTKPDGFGLGLAICRDVIQRQNGSITVTNNPERGCTFSVRLNLWSEDDSSGEVNA
jgi:signal transduction histidine kinase